MYKFLIFFFCTVINWLHAIEASPLTVGTNAEFPPFCYIENKEIVGFDIDVAKEIAHRLGRNITFKDMPFDALIPEIVLGRVDFAAAGMSITEERAKRVSFTRPYLSEDPLVIISSAKQKLNLDDLLDRIVVVVEGFTADFFMSSKPGIRLIRLPTQADGFLAVKSGRASAFVTAQSTVRNFFEVADSSQFHVEVIKGTGETCALVVPKHQAKMLENIQTALDEMEKDGTMALLKAKWKFQ
jgi:ABC-type amino acid transport substrate-binding protein